MLIGQVLRRRAPQPLSTLTPAAPMYTAAELLAEQPVVVIASQLQPEGILSRSDMMRALNSGDVLGDPVMHHMTRSVVTCTADQTLSAVLSLMTTHHIHHVPVLERGQIVDVVHLEDLVEARLAQEAREKEAARMLVMAT